jgi:acyl-CoA dehydrogenase
MLPRTLFSSEHEMLRDSFRKFLQAEAVPHYEKWEKVGQVDKSIWKAAGEQGYLAPLVSEEYGGLGLDFLYNVILTEEIGRLGLNGIGFPLHSDIVVPYLSRLGTEEQKQKYLPACVSGEIVTAIAMTEPGTGSDLQGIKTTAKKEGDDFIINGSKTFITNGQLADLVIVVAVTDPTAGAKGLSLILVEANTPGFERGSNLAKIGMKSQDTSELFFNDVRVPQSNLLGPEGSGFAQLMAELPQERLTIAVHCMAMCESVLAQTVEYVKERKAFGQNIGAFQNTQFVLADLDTEIDAARAFTDRCIELHLTKDLTTELASKAKLLVTELLGKVVDKCLQLYGGYGYMLEYPVARAYADARVMRIYGGTSEIMKLIVARQLLK